MRLFIVTVTSVMLASAFDIARVAPAPLSAADRVPELVAQARRALGGEDKVAGVKSLSATGAFRRSMGDRQMEGTSELLIVRPDKMRRSEEMTMGGMVGGPTVERISVLAGTDAWDDVQNRGGGGGGMRFEMRMDRGGPGGPGGPGGGDRQPPTEEQLREARVRRMKAEMLRWTVALLVDSPQAFADGGVAESPDGRADILETTDESGRSVKLFIDQATHQPLMVQYQEMRPRVMMAGGPGGRRGPGGTAGPGGAAPPSREEMEQRREEMRRNPPPPSTFTMHLDDYRKVDGILLPHTIGLAIDGEPNEELTIDKYKVNPAVRPADFEKPKQAQ